MVIGSEVEGVEEKRRCGLLRARADTCMPSVRLAFASIQVHYLVLQILPGPFPVTFLSILMLIL